MKNNYDEDQKDLSRARRSGMTFTTITNKEKFLK